MPNARHKEEAGHQQFHLTKHSMFQQWLAKLKIKQKQKLNKKADQEFHQKDYLITTKEIPKLSMQRVIIESN